MFQHFKATNTRLTEKSCWTDEDEMITFCIEAPQDAITRDKLSAVDFLKNVISTQQNWVVPGTARPDLHPGLHHNVSNTCTVKPDEWEQVGEFIWQNRKLLTGVTLLPYDGDKKYPQAPHEDVTTEEDEVLWNALCEAYKPVDYATLSEAGDATNHRQEAACAGGKCDLF